MTTVPPDKSSFSIDDAAQQLGVRPYIIRYWESEFGAFLSPQSSTPRRAFTREEFEVLLHIQRLLHEERYTIAGARQRLQALIDRREYASDETPMLSLSSRDGDEAFFTSFDLEDSDALLSARAATLEEARVLIERLQRALESAQLRLKDALDAAAAFRDDDDGSFMMLSDEPISSDDSFWLVPDPLLDDQSVPPLTAGEPEMLVLDLPLQSAGLPPLFGADEKRALDALSAKHGALEAENAGLRDALAEAELERDALLRQLEEAIRRADEPSGDEEKEIGTDVDALRAFEEERATLLEQLDALRAFEEERATLLERLDKLQGLEEERAALLKQLDALRGFEEERTTLLEQLKDARAKVETFAGQFAALEEEQAALRATLADIEAEREALKSQLQETKTQEEPPALPALDFRLTPAVLTPPKDEVKVSRAVEGNPEQLREDIELLERKLDYQASRQRHKLRQIRHRLVALNDFLKA